MHISKALKTRLTIILTICLVASTLFVFTGTSSAYSSKVYEVGPGQAFASINAVPWENLNAGDTVNIHWRPTAYKEKILTVAQGTSKLPVTIHGVPGPNGELPVIDGNGATTRSTMDSSKADRGIIIVGSSTAVGPNYKSNYVTIDNLEIIGCRPEYKFTDAKGKEKSYNEFCAGVWIDKGDNIVLRNCSIHDCANGLYTISRYDPGYEDFVSYNMLVEGNYIYDNGNDKSMYEHNSYCANVGILYQYNHYGPLRSGATGYGLKDRSAGTVVRYNWIEGGRRQISLDDGEDSYQIPIQKTYDDAYVYGNVLIENDDGVLRLWGDDEIVSYGGDNDEVRDRQGTLYFYNNTVVTYRNKKVYDDSNSFSKWVIGRTERTCLFYLPTPDQTVDARNNIFYAAGDAPITLMNDNGAANFSHNWISSGWLNSLEDPVFWTINFDNTNIVGTDPGFVNLAAKNFRLAKGSPCINAGASLNPAVPRDYLPKRQYSEHQKYKARPVTGKIDIGAFEAY